MLLTHKKSFSHHLLPIALEMGSEGSAHKFFLAARKQKHVLIWGFCPIPHVLWHLRVGMAGVSCMSGIKCCLSSSQSLKHRVNISSSL